MLLEERIICAKVLRILDLFEEPTKMSGWLERIKLGKQECLIRNRLERELEYVTWGFRGIGKTFYFIDV